MWQRALAVLAPGAGRFDRAQCVVATPSLFLLARPGARVYDLDSAPVRARRWTELPGVRATYEFFRDHAAAFEEEA